jgi:hypothetical protein
LSEQGFSLSQQGFSFLRTLRFLFPSRKLHFVPAGFLFFENPAFLIPITQIALGIEVDTGQAAKASSSMNVKPARMPKTKTFLIFVPAGFLFFENPAFLIPFTQIALGIEVDTGQAAKASSSQPAVGRYERKARPPVLRQVEMLKTKTFLIFIAKHKNTCY